MAYQGFQGPRFKSESLGPSSSIYLNRKVMQSHKSKKKTKHCLGNLLDWQKKSELMGPLDIGDPGSMNTPLQSLCNCVRSFNRFSGKRNRHPDPYIRVLFFIPSPDTIDDPLRIVTQEHVYYGDYCYGNWDSHDMLQWPTNYSS